MNNEYKYMGLIPARSGSKGIPKKNLKKVFGKPLIEHTFNAAQESINLTKTYVSSDDDEIIKLADCFNLFTFKRPSKIAADSTSMSEVIEHFINNFLMKEDFKTTHIVLLQPTSPLRNGMDIDKAIVKHRKSSKNCLVSVRESKEVIQKSFYLDRDSYLTTVFQEKEAHKRRQDLRKTYYPNGAIYIFSINSFLVKNEIPLNYSIPFLMSNQKSIDIDTFDDIKYLEYTRNLNYE